MASIAMALRRATAVAARGGAYRAARQAPSSPKSPALRGQSLGHLRGTPLRTAAAAVPASPEPEPEAEPEPQPETGGAAANAPQEDGEVQAAEEREPAEAAKQPTDEANDTDEAESEVDPGTAAALHIFESSALSH